jgi:hypothetical protein
MDCRRNFFAMLAGLFAGLFAARPAEGQTGSARYHPGHRCPGCRRAVYTVHRRGPGRFHTHRCPGGTLWYH